MWSSHIKTGTQNAQKLQSLELQFHNKTITITTTSVLYIRIYKKNHIIVCGEKHASAKHVEDRYAEFLPRLLEK